jgi:hypothetical protein
VAIFFLSLSAAAMAAEPGSGVIEGRIVNGTAGGSRVADQEVTLTTYLNNNEVGSATTRTDVEGGFVFDGLATGSDYSYQVTVSFQEADYSSERLGFNEGETTKNVEVTVYDSTTSDEAIKVKTAHTIIYVGPEALEVVEYSLFVNEADRTYIGSKEVPTLGGKETLRFSLPKEATGLQPGIGLMSCCIATSEDGFVDTMPVFPGAKEVVYSYKVDPGSGTYALSRNVNYPTVGYDLLVQGEGIEVASDRLTAGEPIVIKGTRFNRLSAQKLVPGDTVVAQISGLPQSNNQGVVLWAVLTLVVFGGFGFVFLRRRRRLQPVSPKDSIDQRRQKLLVEIARLDDDFEGGRIPEEVYQRQRARRKAQLVELMQDFKGSSQ